MTTDIQRAQELAIGDLDRQPAIEQARKVCAMVLIPLILITAPIGFLTSSLVVASISSAFLTVSGAALFLVEWAAQN
jgi:hypothetical protein